MSVTAKYILTLCLYLTAGNVSVIWWLYFYGPFPKVRVSPEMVAKWIWCITTKSPIKHPTDAECVMSYDTIHQRYEWQRLNQYLLSFQYSEDSILERLWRRTFQYSNTKFNWVLEKIPGTRMSAHVVVNKSSWSLPPHRLQLSCHGRKKTIFFSFLYVVFHLESYNGTKEAYYWWK